MNNLHSYFSVLGELSLKAGAIVRRYFNTQFEVERKADDSPVTQADREVETFLRAALEKQFPDYSIQGEEFGETKKSGSHRWIIDPIDGTKSFVMRTPLFGVMIALEREGQPVLGSIYFPIQDQLLIGSAETGTFLNGKPCAVSQTSSLAEATMIITDPRDLYAGARGAQLQRLANRVRLVRGFGDCYGYSLVAQGFADLMVEPDGLKYHDVAPLGPILQGAGGTFTDLSGQIDFTNGQGLASNRTLHEQALAVLHSE